MSKKTVILIGALAIVGIAAFCGTSYYKSKQLEHKEQAINNIKDGNYEEAIEDLDSNNDSESEELLELALSCQKMKKAYLEEDYKKTEKIVEEIKTMKNLNLVTDKIDSVDAKTREKLKEIDIENINDKIDTLINNNDFEKAEELINEYKDKGINEELNEINDKVMMAKEKGGDLKNKVDEKQEALGKVKNIIGLIRK